MIFKKNKFVAYISTLIILASCSTTSKNLLSNSTKIPEAANDRNLNEIYNYQGYFVNDVEIIQQAIKSGTLNQEQLKDAKLLKKNYQKILAKDKFLLQLNPYHQHSEELIKLIYQLNLPINISWTDIKKSSLQENLLSTKINGFCSSLYNDSILSINKEINKSTDSILVIYSQEYESLLQSLESYNSSISTLKFKSFNFQEFTAETLGINSSKRRFKKISNLNPNQNLKFMPRSRSDVQQIVLLIKSQDYKAMIPSLRYHGGNKFKYLNFVSSLEEINDPLQLLDYEDSFVPISIFLSKKIQNNNSVSLEKFLEQGVLNDWLIIQVLKQSGVQSAKINGVTGTIIYKLNSCAKREIPLQRISADLFSS